MRTCRSAGNEEREREREKERERGGERERERERESLFYEFWNQYLELQYLDHDSIT